MPSRPAILLAAVVARKLALATFRSGETFDGVRHVVPFEPLGLLLVEAEIDGRHRVVEVGQLGGADDRRSDRGPTGQPAARLYVLHNWSWDEATATPPVKVTDLLEGGSHPPGEPIRLQAWDVLLLRSEELPGAERPGL